ncbi:hypothetical protein TTHT_2082 [Thermotomaculum hydrothermale]|uniref:Uncharacterized protein n=1 Tax=Thermotomaculum hydrothermale TaxID=981385 RepID=A0A7R6PSI0_9BACT|nr:hypothetical protein [Thermotomaculum hydrothermale]BBB33521.1 hypothetical protein TTHT_2082 [Thermotomaculum hydrothermale]
MEKSLIEFRNKFFEKLYILLTSQWKILGIPFQNIKSKPNFIIDIEGLLLLSLSFFRLYPREFDEVINWLYYQGNIVNIQRLKNISQKKAFSSLSVLSAVADFLSENQKQPKWKGLTKFKNNKREVLFWDKDLKPYPQFGENEETFLKHNYLRGKISLKNDIIFDCGTNSYFLNLKLRHLLGVNIRSEIISYLLLSNEGNSNSISNEIFFLQKSVYEILKELEKGNFIFPTKKGRAINYKIDKKNWLRFLNITEPLPDYLNIAKIFYAYDIILDFLFKSKEKSGISLEYSLKKAFNEFLKEIEESNLSLYLPEKTPHFTQREIYKTILKSIDKLLN